tara:strand:+ start:411 stop:830 length:420 start_codon:yes stop_codon:yes gene_type:complete
VTKKKELSQEDLKTWEEYTKNPSDIFDKEKNNPKSSNKNNRYRFDLHGFTLDEANQKVKEIIFYCKKKNYKEILLITGKGIHSTNENDVYVSRDLSKLKFSVPEFIQSNQELSKLIISINEAEIKDGGEGALLIELRNL